MPRFIEHTQTARSILVLLNNISELITISQDRKGAIEVLDCLEKYASNHTFPLPQDKVRNFKRVCLDSRAITLNSIIKDIAMFVVSYDRERQIKKNKRDRIESLNKDNPNIQTDQS